MNVNGSQEEVGTQEQYSLAKIIGIWALAAVPMAALAWIVFPALKGSAQMNPGILLWLLMIAGMMWQVVLSLAILYRETGTLKLGTIRQRTWRQKPRDPKTGQPNGKLWLWLIPGVLLTATVQFALTQPITNLWTTLLPFFAEPPGYNLASLMDTPETWVGAWYLLVLWALQVLGNYWLGEEFLFRSVLLPKMQGVFGRRDWLANAAAFGLYHLHKPWDIPAAMLSGFVYAYLSRRFRSAWFGLILHGAEGLFFLFIMLGLVLGLT